MRKFFFSVVPKLLFILTAALVILLAKGWQYDFEEGTIVKTGMLDIHSQPKGATISLDGEESGLTPQKVPGLKPQRYQLTLTKENYEPWQKNVVVNAELATRVYDVILFALSPLLERQSVPEFSHILKSDTQERIMVLSPAPLDPAASVITVYSNQFDRLYQSQLPISRDTAAMQAHWSPDLNSCILNIMSTVNGNQTLSDSYLISIKDSTAAPASLLSLSWFSADPSPLMRPVWAQDDRSLIISHDSQIKAVDLKERTEHSVITGAKGIQPLFTAPSSGFFSKTRLYYLKARTDASTYDLWYQELPDGSNGQVTTSHPFSPVISLSVSQDYNNIFLTDAVSSTILMNISSQAPGERTAPRQITQPLGWSPDGERFLFVSDDRQISYYDQLRDTFLYPYQLKDGELLDSACWHPDSLHIFFQTTVTADEQTRHQINAIEFDGKNLVTVFDDREDFPGIESLNTELPVIAPTARSLVIASIIERKTDPPLLFLYDLRYD